ncbi:hypothetical protein M595_4010 [Lyngbya aestuarii BL J]|uniref:Uncharacterized protein n=1 Tax=Lyngbya aestuarii BL J TaxID=1348334 RepID=U7QDQ9_9CYAN|nr:hypothetical protein M595_4010 [Lyngbya aestuarii BL J]
MLLNARINHCKQLVVCLFLDSLANSNRNYGLMRMLPIFE